jgi:hypothetical protein
MRLADFIAANIEAILTEWDAFARSLYPQMTQLALRDHARQILATVVADLSTSQTKQEQSEKSMGHAPKVPNAPETAAETHAVLRAQGGININQLAAEYRALRASVLRLWEEPHHPGVEGLQDVIRFNEAIDQALAESIGFFSATVDRSRNLLLGMLGHDMRNPLNAIVMVAQLASSAPQKLMTIAGTGFCLPLFEPPAPVMPPSPAATRCGQRAILQLRERQ